MSPWGNEYISTMVSREVGVDLRKTTTSRKKVRTPLPSSLLTTMAVDCESLNKATAKAGVGVCASPPRAAMLSRTKTKAKGIFIQSK
jgi:hypothetical protein